MRIPIHMSQLTVVCANMTALLLDLNLLGIGLHHVSRIDELTASFCVRQNQVDLTVKIIQNAGGKIINNIPASGFLLMKSILKRPVLLFGNILLLFLSLWLPTRVLFVTVAGNEQLAQRQIIDAAAACGVRFGAARHEIRSEKIKNLLLAELPELKWVGVNTRGCVAQISVKERAQQEKGLNLPMISSIVATQDGIVQEMTIRNGNPVCRVGQAVRKGELLVSGYSDCGRCIYGTRADADIYAQTRRALCMKMLTQGNGRGGVVGFRRKIGLIIGKKRINFYKGSGISDTTCVRMYKEYPLTLPGGFQLPIIVTFQEETDYTVAAVANDPQDTEYILKCAAKDYLEKQMIAGKIREANYQNAETNGAMSLFGQYICDEIIGQTRSEEIINYYEQTN